MGSSEAESIRGAFSGFLELLVNVNPCKDKRHKTMHDCWVLLSFIFSPTRFGKDDPN